MDDATDKQNTGAIDEAQTGKGKSGRGSASGSAGSVRLPVDKLKEVTKNWEYLDATKVVARLAEFFSEGVARATANATINWANLTNKGFAIVSHILKFGQEVSKLIHNPTRENVERLRAEYGIQISSPSAG